MPKQGIASAFLFGVGFGSILSVLQAMHIPIEFVTPVVWKRSYGLSKDKAPIRVKTRAVHRRPMDEDDQEEGHEV